MEVVKNNKWYESLFNNGQKYCPKCDKIKPLDDFSNEKKSVRGKYCYCKKCKSKARYEKIKQGEENRYKKYLESDWYKKRLENIASEHIPTDNTKKSMSDFHKKLQMEKRNKFRRLPKYQ